MEYVCKTILHCVTFIVVPAYERADCLATKVTIVDQKAKDRADILNIVMATTGIIFRLQAGFYIIWQTELVVTMGVVRNTCHSGNNRRLIN